MRKFLALFVLFALPIIALAQTEAQVEISSLRPSAYIIQAQQPISGTLELLNVGDLKAENVLYDVAYGAFSTETQTLTHVFGIYKNDEVIGLEAGSSASSKFDFMPDLSVGNISGIEVRVYDMNGNILTTQALSVSVQGQAALPPMLFELTDEPFVIPLTEGDVPGEYVSGTPEIPSKTNRLAFLPASESVDLGSLVAKAVLYDTAAYGKKVLDQEIPMYEQSGYVIVDLPALEDAPRYYGYVYFEDESGKVSNKMEVSYTNTMSSAQIVSVTKQSLEEGIVRVDIDYYAFSNFGLDPADQVKNALFRVELINNNGDVLSTQEISAEVLKDFEISTSTDDMIEDKEFAKTLMSVLRASVDLPFSGDSSNTTVRVTMFDGDTNEALDMYETLVPTVMSQEQKDWAVQPLLIALVAILLIVAILVFKRKVNIVTVAIVPLLIFGAVASVAMAKIVLYDEGEWGRSDMGEKPSITVAISSSTGGYASTTTSMPYKVTYWQRLWDSNGYHLLQTIYPKTGSTEWQGFTTASAARDHMKSSVGSTKKTVWSPALRQWRIPNLSSNTDYVSTEKVAYKIGKSYQYTNASLPRTGNLTPGMHYFPVGTLFCTDSHGCMTEMSVSVYQICVFGAGVCVGEVYNADVCPLKNGNPDPYEDLTVPTGYVRDINGNCTDMTGLCYPTTPPVDYNQPCGCSDSGKIKCDGTCSVAACGDEVSCSASPDPAIVDVSSVRFTATPTAGARYRWSDTSGGLSSASWGAVDSNTLNETFFTLGTRDKYVQIDTDGNGTSNGQGSCTVDVGCNGPQPANECVGTSQYSYSCTDAGWVRANTGTCGGGGGPGPTSPTISKFELRPNIVAAGGTCKVNAAAANVSSCTLKKAGLDYQVINSPYISSNNLSLNGQVFLPVGTYTLSCTGVGIGAPTVTFDQSKRCIAAPVWQEF